MEKKSTFRAFASRAKKRNSNQCETVRIPVGKAAVLLVIRVWSFIRQVRIMMAKNSLMALLWENLIRKKAIKENKLLTMTIPVVEFQAREYKIKTIFA